MPEIRPRREERPAVVEAGPDRVGDNLPYSCASRPFADGYRPDALTPSNCRYL